MISQAKTLKGFRVAGAKGMSAAACGTVVVHAALTARLALARSSRHAVVGQNRRTSENTDPRGQGERLQGESANVLHERSHCQFPVNLWKPSMTLGVSQNRAQSGFFRCKRGHINASPAAARYPPAAGKAAASCPPE
jgi:hypothetical protein